MSERDLFGDLVDEHAHKVDDGYREDWEPSPHSCWDCIHLELPIKGFRERNRCLLLNREVDRVAGWCHRHELRDNA